MPFLHNQPVNRQIFLPESVIYDAGFAQSVGKRQIFLPESVICDALLHNQLANGRYFYSNQ